MQKVILTEKGLQLQQDVKLEVLTDKAQQEHNKKNNRKNNDYNNQRVSTLEGISEENPKGGYQRVQLDYLQNNNKDQYKKCQTEEEIQHILLPHKDLQKLKSPYIKQKLLAATQSILNPPILSPIQTKQDRDINNLFTSAGPRWGQISHGNLLSSFEQQQNRIINQNKNVSQISFINNNSQLGSNIFQNPSKLVVLQDMVQQQKQNQLMHHESKFQRLVDNWQNLQLTREKQKNSLQKSISKSITKQTLNTRPETLNEIKSKHQEVLDIIYQENNIKERVSAVYQQLHQKTIQKKWQNTYFPTSVQEKKEKGIKFTYEPYKTLIKKEKNEDLQLKISKVWKKQQ